MSSARILIVEDEFAVAMELEHRLAALGYDVIGHEMTGPDAVERAAETAPDLVLMDVNLADAAEAGAGEASMDGVEAAQKIRATRPVPVVFVTAYSDSETVQRAASTTPYGYIVKPIEERELYASIEVALKTHALQQRVEQSRDDLRQILNSLRQGTLLLAPDGTLSFVSEPAADLLGRSPEALCGLPWEEALPVDADTTARLRTHIETETTDPLRLALPASSSSAGGPAQGRQVEVEVRPDPRSPDRRILVLYDVTTVEDLRRLLDDGDRFHDLVGTSPSMQALYDQIRSLGPVDVTVQIRGETGTGKELVARALHAESPRADAPFVAVNGAALQPDLAGSLLFGHRKGAFTGAVEDRAGYFEAADGGTLFLDEVGDLPLDVQQQLLRVLEERSITRVGDTQERSVDVRIISATHRALEEAVQAGTFREDLLYRIRVARLDVPPLRERLSDLPLLVRTLQRRAAARMGLPPKSISEDALRRLLDHDWPGNVRELRNAVESSLLHAEGSVVRARDLPPELSGSTDRTEAAAAPEAERIRAALRETDGNRSAAADLLGVSRSTLYRRLREYRID